MANISQNVNIEMLEKLPDGTYKRKYPKTRSDTGVTFDEHLAPNANPHGVTKTQVGLGNLDNLKQAPFNHEHIEYKVITDGSYAGDDTSDRFINVGFTPTFVIIFTNNKAHDKSTVWFVFSGFSVKLANSSTSTTDGIYVIENGFRVHLDYRYANGSGTTYTYVAFK